jgi:hypothetical protein
VIDDDPAICRYLRRGLAHDSYDSSWTVTFANFLI